MRVRSYVFVAIAVVVHTGVVFLLPNARKAPAFALKEDDTLVDMTEGERVAEEHAQAFGMLTTTRASKPGAHGLFLVPKASGTEASAGGTVSPPPLGTVTGPPSLFSNEDLGLTGSDSFRVDVAKQLPDEHAIENANARNAIMDPIRAREVASGDVTSGPVVTQIERSAREVPTAPYEGRAVLAVRVDELGLVLSVGVDDASGNRRDWNDVATHAFNALVRTRLRMPPASKRLAMHIEVTAKVALPSGASTLRVGSPAGSAISNVTKDKFDRMPDDGTGTDPIVGGQFDASKVGGHAMRMVAARVVSTNAF